MLIKKQAVAYSYLILSMIFLGSTFVLGKDLISIMPIFLLLSIRFFIGSSFFSVFFIIKKQKKSQADRLTKKEFGILFLQAFFGAFLFNLFMLWGLHYISASYAAIVTSTIPGFIMLFSYFILRETITKTKIVSIIVSMLGLILISCQSLIIDAQPPIILGMLLMFFAVISGALFPICVKSIANKVSPNLISLLFNIFGLILFLPFTVHEIAGFQFSMITLSTWVLIVFYSLAANVLYVSLWNKGLAIVPANTASLFIAIMPITTTILAYFFLHEILTPLQAVGMLLVLLALSFGLTHS